MVAITSLPPSRRRATSLRMTRSPVLSSCPPMMIRGPLPMGRLQDDAGRIQAQGGGRKGGTKGLDLRPNCFDTGRRQDDEVPGSRRFKTCGHGVLFLLHAAETRAVRTASQRAFGEKADHFTGGTTAVIRRLPENDLVEKAGADLAHGDDFLRPPVAGDADHGDGPTAGGPDRGHKAAEGPKAVRIVGVVHDDPEAVLVADVEAAG